MLCSCIVVCRAEILNVSHFNFYYSFHFPSCFPVQSPLCVCVCVLFRNKYINAHKSNCGIDRSVLFWKLSYEKMDSFIFSFDFLPGWQNTASVETIAMSLVTRRVWCERQSVNMGAETKVPPLLHSASVSSVNPEWICCLQSSPTIKCLQLRNIQIMWRWSTISFMKINNVA